MLAFDPHPHGCPLTLAVPPQDMPAAVKTVYVQLRDLVHCAVLEVAPQKRRAYPLLQLFALPDDKRPRLVLFPAWEDDGATRRLDFDRQYQLLQQIHDEGVEGEPLEAFRGIVDRQRAVEPPVLRVAFTVDGMKGLVDDLLEYLADLARVMVVKVPLDRKPVVVVRIYGVGPETVPRLVLVPYWGNDGEPLDEASQSRLLAALAGRPEIPAEAFGL